MTAKVFLKIKYTFVLVFFILLSFSISAQTADLILKVTNISPLTGKIMVAVFNSEETYFDVDKMYAGYEIAADSSVVVYVIQDLPVGTYAITIYHDEDNNGEMNRSWLGMPKEGYAFSNNFTSAIRPASFSDAAFQLSRDTTLVIKMNY
ncbi:MAG TPA: DUF2141 domain-containing protein [Bacteroidales bacterium]